MKIKELAVTASFLLVLGGLGIGSLLLPDKAVSTSERRPLTQIESYGDKQTAATNQGEAYGFSTYFSYLEDYLLDQFPARDTFRSVKAVMKQFVLWQKDNNGYYFADGTLCKQDGTLSEAAVNDALKRFQSIVEKFFSGEKQNVYYSIVPDKNYFTADKNGYLHYDYDALYETVRSQLGDKLTEIEIRDLLSIDDYYRTDPHWDQSKILPIADKLLAAMGATGTASGQSWTENKLSPFYGTYWGQAALPVAGDTLTYLTSEALNGVTVYSYETEETRPLYDPENFGNVDPYDVFMDGAASLLRIDNPNVTNGKQLVVFRDSFGSSLVPLLVSGYSQIIVVDIRYVSPSFLGELVVFRPNCTALFLYSTSVINSYGVFKK